MFASGAGRGLLGGRMIDNGTVGLYGVSSGYAHDAPIFADGIMPFIRRQAMRKKI